MIYTYWERYMNYHHIRFMTIHLMQLFLDNLHYGVGRSNKMLYIS